MNRRAPSSPCTSRRTDSWAVTRLGKEASGLAEQIKDLLDVLASRAACWGSSKAELADYRGRIRRAAPVRIRRG